MPTGNSVKNAGSENKNSSNPLRNDRTYISGGSQSSASHQFRQKAAEKAATKSKND
jgi:hypothetical protein